MSTAEDSGAEAEQEADRLERLVAALRQEIAREPVPDRLRELAERLEQAMRACSAGIPPEK